MKHNKTNTKLLISAILSFLLFASCAHQPGGDMGITVTGSGAVSAAPDMARITLSLSELEDTTAAAQEKVSGMTARTLKILGDHRIADEDIQTRTLTFSPEYDWTDQGRKLLGQRARQTLVVAVKEIQESPARLSELLDQLAEIDGIELQNIEFDLIEKDELAARARSLAFEKAAAKAAQYADLAGRPLGEVLRIQESSSPAAFPANARLMLAEAAPGAVPAGEMEISVQVTLLYDLK